jgi:hypothetical protein
MVELIQHVMAALPFQFLHPLTDAYLRRYRNEQVDMIVAHIPFQNFCVFSAALPYQLPHPCRNFSAHNRLAILGRPHQISTDYQLKPGGIKKHYKCLDD